MSNITSSRHRHQRMVLATFVTSLALVFAFAAPSQAAQNDELAKGGFTVTAEDERQLSLIGQATDIEDGMLSFDYAEALELGASQAFADDYALGVVVGGQSVLNGPSSLQERAAEAEPLMMAAAACLGSTYVGTYWWGQQLALNSCQTNLLVNAMWTGVGIAMIAGLISSWTGYGGALGAVAAAVLTVGAGAIGMCNMYGRGVYLNHLWTGQPFCWGQ